MDPSSKNRIQILWAILKSSFRLFLKNDPLRIAGATAFFTIFALPPILIIIFRIFSLLMNPILLRDQLFNKLSNIIGREAMLQVVSIIRAFRDLTNKAMLTTIFGFLFLLFIATTLFKVIRSSLNQIWSVDSSAHKKIVAGLDYRIRSIGIILLAGLLFTLNIFLETLTLFLKVYIAKRFPHLSIPLFEITGFAITVISVAGWFVVLFRYLSDARPAWNIAWSGALFTSVFFLIGRSILHVLLNYNNINTIYGTSAAIVLILLFVFYLAMILYFGASFTKMWSIYKKQPISPFIG